MGRTCRIPGCKRQNLPGTSFHRLPLSGSPNRSAWIEFIRSAKKDDSWEPGNKGCFLCIHHFEGGWSYKSGTNPATRLMRVAVPTLLFESENEARWSEYNMNSDTVKHEAEESSNVSDTKYLLITEPNDDDETTENTRNEQMLDGLALPLGSSVEEAMPMELDPETEAEVSSCEVYCYRPEMEHQPVRNLLNRDLKFLIFKDGSLDLAVQKVFPHLKSPLTENELEILRQAMYTLKNVFETRFKSTYSFEKDFDQWLTSPVRVPACLLQHGYVENYMESECANCLVLFKARLNTGPEKIKCRSKSLEAFQVVFEGLLRNTNAKLANELLSYTLPDLCPNCESLLHALHRTYLNFMNVTGSASPVRKLLGKSVLWNIPTKPDRLKNPKSNAESAVPGQKRKISDPHVYKGNSERGKSKLKKYQENSSQVKVTVNGDESDEFTEQPRPVVTPAVRPSLLKVRPRSDKPKSTESVQWASRLQNAQSGDFQAFSTDVDGLADQNFDPESDPLQLSEPEDEKEAFRKGELNLFSCPNCPRMYTCKRLYNEHIKWHASKSAPMQQPTTTLAIL